MDEERKIWDEEIQCVKEIVTHTGGKWASRVIAGLS